MQKTFIIIFTAIFALAGCSTVTTSVDYKPLMKAREAKRASYLNSCELVTYPPADTRLLKELPNRQLSEDEKKRFIGGNWGRYAYFLRRPVVDVVDDAMVCEFKAVGYRVVRGTGSEGPSQGHRYYLITQLKLADATFHQGGKVTASANIILDAPK